MGGPPLVGWLLVVLGTATGLSCLLRTRAAAGMRLPRGERGVARAEGVKGLGMALMAVPGSVLDQHPWSTPLFTAVFGAMALWSVALLWRGGHPVHHVHLALGAAAMVYMTVAMAAVPDADGMAGMAGMGGTGTARTGVPLVTGALLGYFALYALWAGLRMLPATVRTAAVPGGTAAEGPDGAGGADGGVLAAPELAAACRVSLGIGMFAMLLTM